MAEKLSVLSRLGYALNRCNFPLFRLKPLQVRCFEYLLKGKGIVAVLHTGFGKSTLLMCENIWNLQRLQYTNFCSFHRQASRKALPKEKRYSSQRTFEVHIRNFAARLKNRGYPAAIVEKDLSEVKFSEKKTSWTKIVPLVTQYHPALSYFKDILTGKWYKIQNQPQLRNIFKEPPLLSYRKGKSLKDILAKAKL